MKYWYCLFVTILIFLLNPPVCVAEENWRDECGVGWDTASLAQPLEKPCRVAYAKYLNKHFHAMNKAIPLLSPKEKQWLESEMKSGETNRAGKALFSLEFNIDRSKEYLSANEGITKALSKGDLPYEIEILNWASLFRNTMGFQGENLQRLITEDVITLNQLSLYSCENKTQAAMCIDVGNFLDIKMPVFDQILRPALEKLE